MSSANARCSSALTIALPPNFTTMVSPWNRFSQGRDSMSTCALACAGGRADRVPLVRNRSRSRSRRHVARVRAVLVHVVVGEIVGEDRGGCLAGVQLDEHLLAAGLRSTCSRGASGRPRGRPAPRSSRRRRRTGRTRACVVPMAASTRPQLGSLPKIAALNRLLRATERPTSTASSSLRAPRTSIAMSWLAPSASACSCRARSRQTSVRAAVNSSSVGHDAGCAGRQQGDLVVRRHAAVGVEPVEGDPGRGAERAVEFVGCQAASVVITTSIVARPGASMPAPLAMPPMRQPSPSTTAVFGTRVGRHDGARGVGPAVGGEPVAAESTPPRAPRRRAGRRSGRSSRPARRRRRRRARRPPPRRCDAWSGSPRAR